jgi:hypothetical protein
MKSPRLGSVGDRGVNAAGMTLGGLLGGLDKPLVELQVAPRGTDIQVRAHTLAEADDLDLPLSAQERDADIIMLVGARGNAATVQLPRFSGAAIRALFVKLDGAAPELAEACAVRGIALVSVHPEARWEHVHGVVGQLLRDGADRTRRQTEGEHAFGAQHDLFGVAMSIASLTCGMVTIDDAHSRLLAFSPLDEFADELRRLSILGRGTPPGHFEALVAEGVFERLRAGELLDMIPTGGSRRRLAVGIHAGPAETGEYLGTIWVQEGGRPFAPEAKDVLRAATRFVARLIGQTRLIASAEEASLQRLLSDADASGDTTRAICRELGLDPSKDCIVVGFDFPGLTGDDWRRSSQAAGILALQATAFNDAARVTSLGGRLYAVFLGISSQDRVVRWARRAVDSMGRPFQLSVRAAVAAPVRGLSGVPGSRDEVDRILDASGSTAGEVVTLKETITDVLLRSITVLLQDERTQRDPRLHALLAYDGSHNAELVSSVYAYLVCFGDVRHAAGQLHIHPNTLRYRLRRAAELSGLDLADADTRCLLQLQLRALVAKS